MHKKLLYIIPLCVIVGVFIYLNRSYAHIYSLFDTTSNPNMTLNYTIGDARATQVVNYSALGDSLTASVGATDAKYTLPYLLSKKIIDKNTKINLFNLGQPGANSEDVLKQQLVPLTAFQPNLITLFIGTNDMHNRVPMAEFKKNYHQILDELAKLTQAKIILINLPYLGADSLIRPPWPEYYDSRIKKYNRVIAQIAEERKLTLVDLYDKTKVYFKDNQSLVYSADLYHPTDAGYAYWADLIYASYH